MANEIVNSGLNPANAYPQTVKSRLEQARKAEAAQQPALSDQLQLSEAGKSLAAEPGFDPQKVSAIKQAIAEGNYPLDARRMAESFAALEKMMSGAASGAPQQGEPA